jgi:hypothetical protein
MFMTTEPPEAGAGATLGWPPSWGSASKSGPAIRDGPPSLGRKRRETRQPQATAIRRFVLCSISHSERESRRPALAAVPAFEAAMD